MQSKSSTRLAIRDRLQKLSEKDRSIESRVIVKRLKEHLGTKHQIIAAYLPYKDEPDIRPLLLDLLKNGSTVCIPGTTRHGMALKKITTLEDIQHDPITRIPEPIDGEEMDEATVTAVIVPGRAFTDTGDRMGRGNGGYDIWIRSQRKRNPSTEFIGVCFDCQILNEVPMDPHDERVDAVVTSSRVLPIDR